MGKKHDEANHGTKLLKLTFHLMSSPHPLSYIRMCEILNCSKQTVMGLLDDLETVLGDSLIREKRGREAIVSIRKNSNRIPTFMSSEDLDSMMMFVQLIQKLMPRPDRLNLNTCLNLFDPSSPNDDMVQDFSGMAFSVTKGMVNIDDKKDILQKIKKAIKQKKVCIITYQKALVGEPKQYCFAPMNIIHYNGVLYIQGWVTEDRGVVHKPEANHPVPIKLKLHRIVDVEPTYRSTELLPNIAPQDMQAFGFMQNPEDRQTVTIKFNPSAAPYVEERTWSSNQQIKVHQDGSLTLTMEVGSVRETISWVLGFGSSATVIDPPELKEAVRKEIAAMQHCYQGEDISQGC